MMDQKNDNSIEEINRDKLYEYIESKEFLAVIFCEYKPIWDHFPEYFL